MAMPRILKQRELSSEYRRITGAELRQHLLLDALEVTTRACDRGFEALLFVFDLFRSDLPPGDVASRIFVEDDGNALRVTG